MSRSTAPSRSQALERPDHPILVSGRSEQALADNIARLAAALGEHGDAALPDIAHTLAAGREHHGRRVAFMAADLETARRRLDELARTPAPAPIATASSATDSEVRAPAISIDRMSRPSWSVPSQWTEPGGRSLSGIDIAAGSNGVHASDSSATPTTR